MITTIMLLIIGILLITINVKAINKDKSSFKGILEKEEVNLKEVQIEVGKLRQEFAETLLELQTEILELKKVPNHSGNIHKNNLEDSKESENSDDKIKDIKDIVDIDFDKVKNIKDAKDTEKRVIESDDFDNALRVKKVQDLINKGLDVEKIADILKVGKGEILLIKELYLK